MDRDSEERPSPDRGAHAHRVQFYRDDAFLIEAIALFLGEGLREGEAAIVVATPAHRAALESQLEAKGFELEAARERGTFRAFDAAATLDEISRDGELDRERFFAWVRARIEAASAAGATRVRCYGEMVALLVRERRLESAVALEKLWNEMIESNEASVLCSYAIVEFAEPETAKVFVRICDEHDEVAVHENRSTLFSDRQRALAVAELQSKARALEREIAQRKRAEAKLTTLNEMSRALSAEHDVERLLQAITDAATELSGARYGAFFHIARSSAGGGLELHSLAGAPRTAFAAFGVPRATALFEPVLRGDTLLRIDDVRADERYGRWAPHFGLPEGHLPVASYLAVPVRSRTGAIFGALFLGHPEVAVFDDAAEQIVVALAAQAAVAVENAQLYEVERRARADAESSSRAKDEFLAMLGHELRNPLSAVSSAVSAARLEPVRRDRSLALAERGISQLSRLIDDLLDVARITSRRIALRTERVELSDVVERALESARPLLSENGNALRIGPLADGLVVDGDPTRLEQVIGNLLTNAARYTDPGGKIDVSAAREGDVAVVRVRDSGIGIAREMLPRVFELFARAEGTLDRAPSGLGVGLTIVRWLVELHGGTVEAASEGLGRGAEFVVRLPLASEGRVGVASTVKSAAVPAREARILVVEDDPDVAESVVLLLEALGHRVSLARDGFAALDAARSASFDLCLIDIGLPELDGYEVARRMRAESELRGGHLVALTGFGRETDRRRALDAGFDEHLSKPASARELSALIARLELR